jgi:hypothetical protein
MKSIQIKRGTQIMFLLSCIIGGVYDEFLDGTNGKTYVK